MLSDKTKDKKTILPWSGLLSYRENAAKDKKTALP